jgi:serine/threonine protein kinase
MSKTVRYDAVASRRARDYRFIEWSDATLLGAGTFGQVYSGIRHPTDWAGVEGGNSGNHTRNLKERPAAVKVMRTNGPDPTKAFLQEIHVMLKIRHRACLRLYAWNVAYPESQPAQFTLVTRQMDTNLRDVLGKPNFGDAERSIVALGVAAGLAYLHSRKIAHCDIKPENILMDKDFWPKIGDFGFSVLMTPRSSLPRGTPTYTAPERGNLSYPVDVYAYGLVLFELFNGGPLRQKGQDHIAWAKFIVDGGRPEFTKELPGPLKELIVNCWDQSPSRRPSFAEIVAQRNTLKIADDDGRFEAYWNYLNHGRQAMERSVDSHESTPASPAD